MRVKSKRTARKCDEEHKSEERGIKEEEKKKEESVPSEEGGRVKEIQKIEKTIGN